jgi:hypothetical protein
VRTGFPEFFSRIGSAIMQNRFKIHDRVSWNSEGPARPMAENDPRYVGAPENPRAIETLATSGRFDSIALD